MALQTSGAISIGDLISEFGGGTRLTDFYRGGSLVPDTPANQNSGPSGLGVPTSGAISLSDFYGASAAAYGTDTLFALSVGFSNVHAIIFINTNGSVGFSTGEGGSSGGEAWYIPPTTNIGNSHWCRLTGTGNTPGGGGSLNTWLALSTGRSWGFSQTVVGGQSFVGTLDISTTSNGSNIVASRNFELTVAM